jgi:probable rRNA maturation factor
VTIDVRVEQRAGLEAQVRRLLTDLARRVVREALTAGRTPDDAEVSVLFVTDKEMRRLNGQYRGVQRPTDVLAFSQQEGPRGDLARNMLGDVVISLDAARRQAARLRHSFRREIGVLLVHGVLHLLGHDHEGRSPQSRAKKARTMRAAERACLDRLEARLIL